FDGDRATVRVIDVAGREIDRFELARGDQPAEHFCAAEVEDLREALRLAVAAPPSLRVPADKGGPIDGELRVPHTLKVPVSGGRGGRRRGGFKRRQKGEGLRVDPGKPLVIPLRGEVAAGNLDVGPRLRIVFEPRFENRVIGLDPVVLAGPDKVTVERVEKAP